MRRLLSFLLTLLIFAPSLFAGSEWRMHPTFDYTVNHVIDTKEYVYFTSKTQKSSPNIDTYSLFRYDKEGEELQSLSTDNLLSFNTVHTMQYNPSKGYLLVVYTNFDIDLIYDDKVVNIPSYMLSSPGFSKKVNGITIDPANDRVYLATDFGYVAINDKKAEIAESRIYGEPLTSFCRIGDKYLAIHGNDLIMADVATPRMSLSDYTLKQTFDTPVEMAPLGSGNLLLGTKGKTNNGVWLINVNGDNISSTISQQGSYFNIENNKNGVTVPTNTTLRQYSENGSYSTITRPQDLYGMSVSSYDMSEIWHGYQRKGITSGKNMTGEGWKTTRDFMQPDAPAPFMATDLAAHPTAGLLIVNYGLDYNLNFSFDHTTPILLSGLRGGRWTNYGPAYTNSSMEKVMTSPNGFAIDPDNPNLLYLTSYRNGLVRLNLSDPNDILHLSGPNDPGASLPGFINFVPAQTGAGKNSCNLSAPHFDSYGNLWMSYANYDDRSNLQLYCWTAADRKASTSPSNVIPPKKLEVKGIASNNMEWLLPLKANSNRNLLIFSNRSWEDQLTVIDTNGTPLDAADDKKFTFNKAIYDQDGNDVKSRNIRTIWEDPSTGYVWIGHEYGLYYFNPKEVLSGKTNVTRVKVSRNDGTNLADYLLNGVIVNKIAADGQGRKWFATNGGGIVCTSSDGREIVMELNTGNSDIPDDIVLGVAYNPSDNSMMISTAGGIAQYFIGGSADAPDQKDVKAYPNPVRPDYMGYVTMEDLPEGCLVKIADASGNMVKELGRVSGRETLWDITNHQFKRVSSGVYYILVSSSGDDSSYSNVGKILVVN